MVLQEEDEVEKEIVSPGCSFESPSLLIAPLQPEEMPESPVLMTSVVSSRCCPLAMLRTSVTCPKAPSASSTYLRQCASIILLKVQRPASGVIAAFVTALLSVGLLLLLLSAAQAAACKSHLLALSPLCSPQPEFSESP